MKAASFLRHKWVSCFMCALFLAATGVAFASAAHGGVNCKAASVKQVAPVEQVVPVQQEVSVKQSSELTLAGKKDAPVKAETKAAQAKQPEVKKEGNTTSFFSFSFLYYLFYKTNFSETTNSAVRSTWSTLVSRLGS